jgi:hypothetical protein
MRIHRGQWAKIKQDADDAVVTIVALHGSGLQIINIGAGDVLDGLSWPACFGRRSTNLAGFVWHLGENGPPVLDLQQLDREPGMLTFKPASGFSVHSTGQIEEDTDTKKGHDDSN